MPTKSVWIHTQGFHLWATVFCYARSSASDLVTNRNYLKEKRKSSTFRTVPVPLPFLSDHAQIHLRQQSLLTESINWSVSANSKRFLTLSRMLLWWTIMHRAGDALSSGKQPWSTGGDGVWWCSPRQETGALSPLVLVLSAIVVLCQPG